MIVVDSRADCRRLAEVERRTGNRRQFSGWDQRVVDRRVPVRIQHQLMAEDVAGRLTGEIEVTVLRQVDRRRLVGRGAILDDQLVGVGQRVGDTDAQVARVAFFAVGARPA